MAYVLTDHRVGFLQIALTDAGFTPANATAAIPTPPTTLGQVVRAVDPVYGEGEFILLLGVVGTVVGTMVTWNATTYQTALSPNTAGLGAPVAVAMAAITAGLFGWYQIGGLAVVTKTATQVTAMVPVYQSATAGQIMPTASTGRQVLGAQSANLATVTTTTGTLIVRLDRPHLQGQIT